MLALLLPIEPIRSRRLFSQPQFVHLSLGQQPLLTKLNVRLQGLLQANQLLLSLPVQQISADSN
jgi:hypothetical protein